MRLDKWLWCARFFKTRAFASIAIKTGKVIANGDRAKPSKVIQPGDNINIRIGPYHYDITVFKLTKGRKSAVHALELYEESNSSVDAREKLSRQLKAEADLYPRSKGRPDKRNRRDLMRYKSSGSFNPDKR